MPLPCSVVCVADVTLPGFSAMAHDDPVHLPPAAAHVGSQPVVDPEPLPEELPPKLDDPPLLPASSPLGFPNVAEASSPAEPVEPGPNGLDEEEPHPAASAATPRAPAASRVMEFGITT